ncbi:MAG: hypothetical protein FIB07_03010 [Candidatus Methanoperedens sp.]|nr:hypothetical protein [Candidatus Methanoperedens sp.]
MKIDIQLFDTVSFLLYSIILYFLSVISRRLGEVMGIGKYYYLYYLGMIFTLAGSIIMSIYFENMPDSKLFGYVLFSIGLTFGLIASIKYWGWLIIELFRG